MQTKTFAVQSEEGPDLAVSAEDIVITPETASEIDTVTISATIRNISTSDASSAKVSFYDGAPAEGRLISETTVTDIRAGTAKTVSYDWSAQKRLGVHDIHVLISDCIPAETNLTNNEAIKSVTIKVTYGLCMFPRIMTKKRTPRIEQGIIFPRIECIMRRF